MLQVLVLVLIWQKGKIEKGKSIHAVTIPTMLGYSTQKYGYSCASVKIYTQMSQLEPSWG
jgi:hypothetical protein